jgi:nucleotide-binding universal stress UspA family protein
LRSNLLHETMATILIANDGSTLAMAALDEGLALARDLGDTVVIVTVWQIPVGEFGAPYPAFAIDELIRVEQEHARGVLEQSAARAKELGVEAETELREGFPPEEICAVADERGVRLLVLGSHGWGALRSILHGSVASGVLHRAKRPVLLVRGDDG